MTGEVIHFRKRVKLNYLRGNYKTGFGLFKDKLSKDAIKRLVAEINQAIFDTVTKNEVRIYRDLGDKVFEFTMPLDKRDTVTVDIPIRIISDEEYEIDWNNAVIIPYIRGENMKLKAPEAEAVRKRLEVEKGGYGSEVEGIPGEYPDEVLGEED